MNKLIQAFLKNNRIAVLGVLQSDGTVHSATLHYAHRENPWSFFFMTEKESRKCESLLDGKEHSASLVIGFSEKEFIAFQAEGTVVLVNQPDGPEWDAYTQKYPDRSGGKNNPHVALLEFKAVWWRYRDYKTNPVTEINSDEAYVKEVKK